MLPQNRRQCVRAVSFLFFFSLLRHGSDTAWTNVLNIVPFRPGRNVNTENFSYLESEILGKKRDGRKKIKEKIDKKETMNLDLQQGTQS